MLLGRIEKKIVKICVDCFRQFQGSAQKKKKKFFFAAGKRARRNVITRARDRLDDPILFPSLAVRSDNTHIYGDDARRMQRYLLRVLCACTTRRTRRTRKCVSLSAFGSRTARARIDPTIRTSARRDVLALITALVSYFLRFLIN